MNKQVVVHLNANHLPWKGCRVSHAEGNVDVDIVKAIVEMSAHKSATFIEENVNLSISLTTVSWRNGLQRALLLV